MQQQTTSHESNEPGTPPPSPVADSIDSEIQTFEELLPENVQELVSSVGWETPTQVQSMCLPHTLRGTDVAGFAQTGTGKTGVFLITLINKILNQREQCQPIHCLIVVPTRELAMQIADECETFFSHMPEDSRAKVAAVYGGMGWDSQAETLAKGVDAVIGTPGRLIDFHKNKVLNLGNIKTLVFDEVDRMFEMGFVSDVEYLMSHIDSNRQTLVFSATTNPKVQELTKSYLKNPVFVSVTPDSLTPEKIEQKAIHCRTEEKLSILLSLIKSEREQKSIIFANTKLTASWLHYKLVGNKVDCELITGDLAQIKRSKLIQKMKDSKELILIATDVASRGLHIGGLTHVYNFDVPEDPANYVHRIGRTARAGNRGKSYTLVCDVYGEAFANVQDLLGDNAPRTEWPTSEMLNVKDNSGIAYQLVADRIEIKPISDLAPKPKREAREARQPRRRGGNRPPRQDRSNERTPAKSSMSIFGMIKRFFALLFGRRQ